MGDGRTRARGRHRRGIQGKGTESRAESSAFHPRLSSLDGARHSSTDGNSDLDTEAVIEHIGGLSSPIILFHFFDTFDGIEGSSADGAMERNKALRRETFHPPKSTSTISTHSTALTASREFNPRRVASASNIVEFIRRGERHRAVSFHP